jgi:hypothetical protein
MVVKKQFRFTGPQACFQQNPMKRLQQVESSLPLDCTEI